MKRLILFLMLFCVGCEDDAGDVVPAPSDPVSQVTIMYFCGTDLKNKGYYNKNILSASKAVANGALGSGGRYLYFLPSSYTEGALYELYNRNGETVKILIESYENSNSLDKDVMSQVISDAKEYAKADTYNLVINSHGAGWVSSGHPYLRSAAVQNEYNYQSGAEYFHKDDSEYVTRFLGCSSDGFMEIAELNSALSKDGGKYGYIIFDACFMSSIEVLYDLRERCDYVIASPPEMMGDGLPYEVVIPELFEQNGTYADLVGACKAFYDYNVENCVGFDNQPVACIALCDMAQLDELAERCREVYSVDKNIVNSSTLQYYEGLSQHVFYDLGQYISLLCADNATLSSFNEQFDKAFPPAARFHTDNYYSCYNVKLNPITYYSGVTTSDPSAKFQDEWVETAWAKAIGAE